MPYFKTSVDGSISKTFTTLYALALTVVALLSIIGQISIQWTLSKQMSDSWIINYAGRQRFKSQQIAKEILILTSSSLVTDKGARLKNLKELVRYWEKYHNEIKEGNLKDIGVTVENSKLVRLYFNKIDSSFQTILRNSKKIIELFESGKQADVELQMCVQKILASESLFLQYMDDIVFQYDREAKEKVHTLRQIEIILFTITIIVLILEGFFVFKPAVQGLKASIEQRIFAEKKAAKINEELAKQNLREQKLRAASLIKGQEEERKRLSRELHDGLGQMMTALKLGIENMEHYIKLPEKGMTALDHLKTMVAQTIQETRIISFNLMPSVLNDFGIVSALKLLVSQTSSNTGISVTFNTNLNGERFAKDVEIGLYRIAQEGINNATKYAKGNFIKLELVSYNKFIQLKIEDDGRGFTYNPDMEKTKVYSTENGISNMRERCDLLNGDFKITSKLGKGTDISITIPNENIG